MAFDAVITLSTLRCIKQHDRSGGSEPYIWPMLAWVDQQTLATPERVRFVAPVVSNARVVIAKDLRRGESASIPGGVGIQRARLEDHDNARRLLLIVVLLEKDDTPAAAVRAGFREFLDATQSSIADQILDLILWSTIGDDAQLNAIIADIQKKVSKRVEGAIFDALPLHQKAKVIAAKTPFGGGGLPAFLDDFVGSSSLMLDDDDVGAFSLRFTKRDQSFASLVLGTGEIRQDFEIDATFETRSVKVDPCAPQVEAVRRAEKLISGLEKTIESLQRQLTHAPPGQKSTLVELIRRYQEEDLPAAWAELERAARDLQFCRLRTVGAVEEAPTYRTSGAAFSPNSA